METYKILHLIDSAGVYGAEKVVLNLLQELQYPTLTGVLGCIRENKLQKPQIAIEAEAKGIKVQYFTMKRGLNIHGIRQIINYVKNNNIHLVHSHGYKSNIFLGLLPKRKFKTVSTVHGWSKKSSGIKTKLYERLDSWSLKRADQVVAVSNGVIRDLEVRGLNKNKIILIYNGINIDGNTPTVDKSTLRKKYGFRDDDYIIGAVGRLSKVKGHISLIEAMHYLKKEIKNCRIIIAGEGPLREQLTTLINDNNFNDEIKLLGYVHNIHEILSLIDIFVLPSLTEGLPISLLEAMIYRKPIVASNVGGIPEIIANNINGILIPPEKPDLLADAIIKLYCQKELTNRFTEYNKKLVEENYSLRQMAKLYYELYINILINKNC